MSERRMLVVDGDARTSQLARDNLARFGRVESVSDGAAALEAVRERPLDLLVADPSAPGIEQVGGLAQLLASAGDAGIVLLAPADGFDSATVAACRGAAGYVAAPAEPGALVQAVEQALALHDLREENKRLHRTIDTFASCGRLARSLDPGTVFAEGVDLLLATTGRSRGIAHFRRPALPSGDGLIFRGFTRGEARRLRGRLGTTEPLGHGAGDRPVVVSESPLHTLLSELGMPEPGAALLVPLAGREREAGVIYMFDAGTDFTETELERSHIVAQQAQAALENAERYQGAKTRALIDDVTGLHNAAYFLDAADHEIERAARYGLQLSVLFLDIDRFKRVNDAHGHLIGSATLRRVAARLRDCVRQIDTLVRYGGDEFTMLLTDTTPEAAMTAAERIRDTVARSPFRDDDGNEISVTVSIGLACYPYDSNQRDELVDLADKAMYRAKSIGRDRVAQARELESD